MVAASIALPVLLAALALFAWLGITARHGAEGDLDDFTTARNSQGALTLGISFLASGMGAWILFAPPQIGAFVGVDGVWGYALAAGAPFAALALCGPPLRRALPDGHSLSEFARVRFGAGFHHAVTAISMLYMLTFIAAELTAVGSVAGILTGASPDLVVLLVAAVTLAYTTVGGLRASLRTDTWQGWLVLALLAGGAAALLGGAHDPVAAWRGSGLLGVDRAGAKVALTLLIAVTAANLFHQGYWQRVWAARDDAALRRGGWLGALLTVPVVLLVGGLGIVAAGAGLDLGVPAAPFFALMRGLAPAVGLAVFVLAVALVASSVDTLQVGLSALTVSERQHTTLAQARAATAVLMVPATLVGLAGTDVLRIFLVADLLATAAVAPALLGLWRRATTAGALAGLAAGLVGAVVPGVLATGSLWGGLVASSFPENVPTLAPFAWSLAASVAVTVAVSLATRTLSESQ